MNSSPDPAESMKGCSLLVVEDNRGDFLLLKRALAMIGVLCDVVVARDGDEAIDYFSGAQQRSNAPTHVLLDVKLPRRDGLEVLAWLRSNPALRKMPVIVLTSSDLDSDRDRAHRFDIDAYLLKPADMEEFARVAATIAEIWRLPLAAPKET